MARNQKKPVPHGGETGEHGRKDCRGAGLGYYFLLLSVLSTFGGESFLPTSTSGRGALPGAIAVPVPRMAGLWEGRKGISHVPSFWLCGEITAAPESRVGGECPSACHRENPDAGTRLPRSGAGSVLQRHTWRNLRMKALLPSHDHHRGSSPTSARSGLGF